MESLAIFLGLNHECRVRDQRLDLERWLKRKRWIERFQYSHKRLKGVAFIQLPSWIELKNEPLQEQLYRVMGKQ